MSAAAEVPVPLLVDVPADLLDGPLDDWGPRPGADSGEPRMSGRIFYGDDGGPVEVGVWACTPGGWAIIDRPDTETVQILSGRARLTDAGGRAAELGPATSSSCRADGRAAGTSWSPCASCTSSSDRLDPISIVGTPRPEIACLTRAPSPRSTSSPPTRCSPTRSGPSATRSAPTWTARSARTSPTGTRPASCPPASWPGRSASLGLLGMHLHGLRLRGHERGRVRPGLPGAGGGRLRASARWCRCRARWRCTRSRRYGTEEQKRAVAARGWPPARRSAASA